MAVLTLADNVVPIDLGNHLATIKWLREFADQLEKGEVPKLDFGMLVGFDVGGALITSTLGEPHDYFRAIGLLELSKLRLSDLLMGA